MSDEARIAELEAELTKYREAVGLASTFAGEVVMNPDDPLAMMQEVEAVLRKDAEGFEQLHTQMAGVSVALNGNATGPNDCKQGDYGWSPAFEEAKRMRKVAERGDYCTNGQCGTCFQCAMGALDPEYAAQMKTIREIQADEPSQEVSEGQQPS